MTITYAFIQEIIINFVQIVLLFIRIEILLYIYFIVFDIFQKYKFYKSIPNKA